MKILLIEAIYNSIPGENNHPPLGLAYIASSLRKQFGKAIEIKIIRDNLANEIKKFQPDVVGISSVSKNYNIAKAHAKIAKRFNLPVIIGGVHISFLPQTLTPDMDFAVIGEGEKTIVNVIGMLILGEKSALSKIKGIAYWQNGKVVVNKPRPFISPIDSIPYPARDLLVVDKHTSMITSRGCPYKCAFCSTSVYTGHRIRCASAEYVADEIESIYKEYKVEFITIYDDLFAIKTDRVMRIVELLEAKNILGKIKFALNTRCDFITDELARLFRQMNVHAVGLGVESGCQQTLDYLKSGGITVGDNANAVRILKKHGIIPQCNFIIGSPYEDREAVEQTLKFIKDNGVHFYDINVLTPFPGTPIWDYAVSRGLVSDDMDWGRLFFNAKYNPVVLSEKISRDEIFEICATMKKKRQRFQKRRQRMELIRHPYKYLFKGILRKVRRKLCH